MQARIAELVYPFFGRVLELRDRLDAGAAPEWDEERSALRKLLDAMRPDGAAEDAALRFDLSELITPAEQERLMFAAIRFALTAWADELLGEHYAWGQRWREQPLEAAVFGSLQGKSKFWDEARYAETRGDRDALEVMLWCAALGYSEAWPGNPESLRAWQERIQEMLNRSMPDLALPSSLAVSPRDRTMPSDLPMRRLVFAALVGIALAAPPMALWLMRG